MTEHDPRRLAAEAETAYQEVRDVIAALDDEQWSTITDAEGWPIGVVANHLSIGSRFVMDLAEHVGEGGEITWDREFVDSANAQAADVFQDVTKQEALATLDEQLPESIRRIREMDPTAISRRAPAPFTYEDGSELWTPGEIIDRMIIKHAHAHLESINASADSPQQGN